MKREQHIIQNTRTPEGVHEFTVLGVNKADESIGNYAIITGKLPSGKIEQVFLNRRPYGNQRETFADSAIFAICDQLEEQNINIPADFDSDDLVLVETVFKGATVKAYCVHTQTTDGKTYANISFNVNDTAVQAMLQMA